MDRNEELVVVALILGGGYLLLTGKLINQTRITAGGLQYTSGQLLGRKTQSIVIPGLGSYSSGPLGTTISVPGLAALFNAFGSPSNAPPSGATSGAAAGVLQPGGGGLPAPPTDSSTVDGMPGMDPNTGDPLTVDTSGNPNLDVPNSLDPTMLVDPTAYMNAIDPVVGADMGLVGAI